MINEQQTPGLIRAERTCGMYHRMLAADGRPIFATVGGGHKKPFTADELEANARRLVACWNACNGFPTDCLEKGKVVIVTGTFPPTPDDSGKYSPEAGLEWFSLEGYPKMQAEITAAREQRDELLATLRQTRLWVIESAASVETQAAQLAIIDAAIAKVTSD